MPGRIPLCKGRKFIPGRRRIIGKHRVVKGYVIFSLKSRVYLKELVTNRTRKVATIIICHRKVLNFREL